jgi:hypothetical protein
VIGHETKSKMVINGSFRSAGPLPPSNLVVSYATRFNEIKALHLIPKPAAKILSLNRVVAAIYKKCGVDYFSYTVLISDCINGTAEMVTCGDA